MKLEAWSRARGSYHTDRQLADEVLIADGWRVQPDIEWEGGIRWSWGSNPEVSASESTRPNPINDLNTAIGVVPFECNWAIAVGDSGRAMAQVWRKGTAPMEKFIGHGEIPAIAVLIAAFRYRIAQNAPTKP